MKLRCAKTDLISAAILDAINEETRIVFLANPNNPTGTMLEAAEIDNLLPKFPGTLWWFWTKPTTSLRRASRTGAKWNIPRSLQHVRQGASVIVLRTFSKAHGLAGLRMGYGLGPAELLAYCARMRDTFSVSSVAQAAALAALDDAKHVERVVSNNAEQAQILGVGLSELGYRVVPTCSELSLLRS